MQRTIQSIAFLMLLVTFSSSSFSQASHFSISVNSLTTNFNYGSSNKMLRADKKDYKGWQAGFSYQAGITKHFSVVPELYFAVKGGRLESTNAISSAGSTLRVSSIDLPVLARLHLGRLYLNGGAYASYLVGGRMKLKGSQSAPASSSKISFDHLPGGFHRWDAGWQAGAGYNFGMKKGLMTLDVRYGYGLVNISRDVERYNRTLNISLVVSKHSRKKSI